MCNAIKWHPGHVFEPKSPIVFNLVLSFWKVHLMNHFILMGITVDNKDVTKIRKGKRFCCNDSRQRDKEV